MVPPWEPWERDLKKDMQTHGADKWGARLDKVVRGAHNQLRRALLGEGTNTAHYKPGQEEPTDKALEFELREHAGQQMATQDAQVRLAQKNVAEAGAFRPYIGRDDRQKRGDRPNYSGSVVTLESFRGDRAIGDKGN